MTGKSGLRVVLVNMPWMPVNVPSLALGILRRAVTQSPVEAEVTVRHANLDFVDWISERYSFTVHDYRYYATSTYFKGLGDWVFSSALYDDPAWRVAEFDERFAATMTPDELALNKDLHTMVPEYVRELAADIVAAEPDVVGFTSTYQQMVAGLATAREIKRLAPHVATVFGGANCDGMQGRALHRNFDVADFVIRGEGEAAFPALLAALGGLGGLGGLGAHDRYAEIPGLCWRAPDGRSVANAMAARPLPPSAIVAPDYDGYYERFEESVAASWLEPQLVVEGARGCWWGEKHHCTFCGLNGTSMEFRSKSPARFHEEIVDLVRRHQILDMVVVDNILDMGYISSLLPRITEDGYDLRIQYEIKSNLRRGQLDVLARAGLVSVQPGIESLSTRVLRIMDKGVTGCQNIRVLRDGASCGLSVMWNYLYGFPGETDEDYQPVIDQMAALHHLEPPGMATRIVVERFSPYFTKPDLGFDRLKPGRQYAMIYDLPEEELYDLAYLFESTPSGIAEPMASRLEAALEEWGKAYPVSRLTWCAVGEEILLVNDRPGFDWDHVRLTSPLELAAFRLLEQPHTPEALGRKLRGDAVPGAGQDAVGALLERWRGLGLLFGDDGHVIHVVPEAVNSELFRIDLERLDDGEDLIEALQEVAG